MSIRNIGTLLRVLIAVVAVDAVISVVLRAELGFEFLHGTHGWLQALALVGLGCTALEAWMLWRFSQGYTSLRRYSEHSGDQLSAVLATSHEWLWEATPELVFVSCSPAASHLLGYTPDEMIGRSAFDLVDDDYRPAMRAYLRHAIAERTGWKDLYARWQHKDGGLVDTIGSAVPILGEHGEVIGFRGARQQVNDVLAESRLAIIRTQVRRYLEHDEIAIALQPLVSLADGRWCDAEALARFPDGRAPELCFQEAREVGLGLELELLALKHALNHLPLLPADVSLSVNASAELVLDERFHRALDRPGLDLRRLVLEITEHTAIADYELLVERIRPLRRRGVRIAVDDTGAGYASFRHVLRLQPDTIKLDRSLLEDVQSNPAARALITAVVMLARELGATVAAEGVESYDVLATVAALGVDTAQGYFIARATTDAIVWASWATTDWTEAVSHEASAL